MKPGRLERMFSVIGDAPEAIAGLRKLVVALAISDKLGDSAAEGPSPQALMERINERKQELVRVGQLQKGQPTPPITQEELPDGLPLSARIVRLRAVANIEKGPTGIAKAKPGPYPLVVTAEQRAACDHFDFDGAAAIVPLVSSTGHGKASLHRLHYQEGRFALGSILAAIFPCAPELLSARFIFEYLSAFKQELLVSRMIGTANVSLSIGKLGDVPVPLIGPSAQARVDELMSLCDRLEAARKERESRRDRLVAASLHRLSQPAEDDDADAFRANARFYFNHLPRLTTRPDHIKQLRQTILNLAVRGLLVPQDPNDEPASELLARKADLPQGYQRRRKILKQARIGISNDYFKRIPSSWAYASIQELYDRRALIDYADGNHGSLYPRKDDFGDDGTTFVTAKDISDGRVLWAGCPKLKTKKAQQLTKGWARGGDVLLTHNATVGRVALTGNEVGDFLLGTSVTFYRFNPEFLDSSFFFRVLESPVWQGQLEAIMAQTTRNQVSIQKQAFFRVPVPPIFEQRRIVARLDELMTLCDRLEASLAETEADSRCLLEAVLHDALEPAENALEAAE